MALTGEDKQKQLRELSSIVSGIRLFNRDCGKGGEGIDDCRSTLCYGENRSMICEFCSAGNSEGCSESYE